MCAHKAQSLYTIHKFYTPWNLTSTVGRAPLCRPSCKMYVRQIYYQHMIEHSKTDVRKSMCLPRKSR
jgi:hypothetical protein